MGGALVTGLAAGLIYKRHIHKTEQQVCNGEMVDVAGYMKQVKNNQPSNDLVIYRMIQTLVAEVHKQCY
ncbi:MAG: hypothetical protein IRD7MM_02435 [Candidatus Midichloria mitochondrii]